MAGNLINTLYPPIVDTFMPAFVYNTDATIYFSLSPYNTNDMVKKIHISLVDSATNQYAFKDGVYPDDIYIVNGILILPFDEKTPIDEDSGLYVIKINPQFLKTEYLENSNTTTDAIWKRDRYYQAQIRLDKSQIDISNAKDYILNQRINFSEWSSVTLLRPISNPALYFSIWDEQRSSSLAPKTQKNGIGSIKEYWAYNQNNVSAYNKGWVDINAEVIWEPIEKNEYLDNYRITIFTEATVDTPIVDSGIMYIGNGQKDTVHYLADLNKGVEGAEYIVQIEATTRNGYSWTTQKRFMIAAYANDDWGLDWEFTTIKLNSYGDTSDKIVTEEDGFVECKLTSQYDMRTGYLYIYRSSSIDNYKKNQIIEVTKQSGRFTHSFKDKTVCSLINYRYKAQFKFKDGNNWTQVSLAPVYVYPDFYDMLLLRQDKQLALRFNGQLSGYKPNINRVKIDTLGGKYPRFAENARMNYRSFSLNGILSSEMDFNREFLNEKDEEFKDSLEAYDNNIGNEWQVRNDTIIKSDENPTRYGQHDTYLHNNWYWERTFREKALEWLNDGQPKLFRSMTEGNIIVILTDVSLSPEKTLGRRLYNFQATAYEIADGMEYSELVDYKIVDYINEEEADLIAAARGQKETTESEDWTEIEVVGQYIVEKDFDVTADLLLGSLLQSGGVSAGHYYPITIRDYLRQLYTGALKNKKLEEETLLLKDVKIQFTSKPLWWKMQDNGSLARVTTEELTDLNPVEDKALLGYKLTLRSKYDDISKTIFVGPKGYYQIPSDIQLSALKLESDEACEINYLLNYKLSYNLSEAVLGTEKIRDIVGQQSGIFYPSVWNGNSIKQKYQQINYRKDSPGGPSIESMEVLQSWSGISFEVTPFALLEIKTTSSAESQEILIPADGVFNLMPDFQLYDFRFLGRRMIEAPQDNRPYLDEWEYRLSPEAQEERDSEEGHIQGISWYEGIDGDAGDPQLTTDIIQINFDSERGPKIVNHKNIASYIIDSLPYDIPIRQWQINDILTEQGQEINNTYNTVFALGMVYTKDEEEYDTLGSDLAISDNTSNMYVTWAMYYTSEIKNPQYNTVYKLVSQSNAIPIYVIYYLDQGWYQVRFIDDHTIVAQVPIYGMVNYRGTILKNSYGA